MVTLLLSLALAAEDCPPCATIPEASREQARASVIRADRRRSAGWAWMGVGAATGITAAVLGNEGNLAYARAGLTGASLVGFGVGGPVAAAAGTDLRAARRSLGQTPGEPVLPIVGWLAYSGSLATGLAAGGLPWISGPDASSSAALPVTSIVLGVAAVTAFEVDAALQVPFTARELRAAPTVGVAPSPGGLAVFGTF
jgi:hypothetical protein